MKNLIFRKSILAVVAVMGLFLTSCDDDNDPQAPITSASAIKGVYEGKLKATKDSASVEHATSFEVGDTLVVFASFPVKDIVSLVVTDSASAAQAVETLGNVKYNVQYTGVVNTAKDGVDMTLTPQPLTIDIPVDGAVKNTVVTFKAPNPGTYVAKSRAIKFELVAESVAVDGISLEPYTTITYEIPSIIKK